MITLKALILAAGYATRLYPLTQNQAKPLIKVAGREIIAHILDKIETIKEIDQIFIITNNRFYPDFEAWLKGQKYSKKIKIINDGTVSNETRLGAIGDLNFVLEREKVKDDMLVIAGDNLFGFSLKDFIGYFKKKKSSVVAFYDLKDLEKVRGRYGVGILKDSRVVDFEEKPLDPRSSLASTACYVFKNSDLQKVEAYIKQKRKVDHPGDLIKHLAQVSEVHGFVFSEHWFDIGSFESLKEAEAAYSKKKA